VKDLESLLEELEDENTNLRSELDEYKPKPVEESDDGLLISSNQNGTFTLSPSSPHISVQAGPAYIDVMDSNGWVAIDGEKLTKDDIATLKEMIEKHLENE
jgi:hypothetical protein